MSHFIFNIFKCGTWCANKKIKTRIYATRAIKGLKSLNMRSALKRSIHGSACISYLYIASCVADLTFISSHCCLCLSNFRLSFMNNFGYHQACGDVFFAHSHRFRYKISRVLIIAAVIQSVFRRLSFFSRDKCFCFALVKTFSIIRYFF